MVTWNVVQGTDASSPRKDIEKKKVENVSLIILSVCVCVGPMCFMLAVCMWYTCVLYIVPVWYVCILYLSGVCGIHV